MSAFYRAGKRGKYEKCGSVEALLRSISARPQLGRRKTRISVFAPDLFTNGLRSKPKRPLCTHALSETHRRRPVRPPRRSRSPRGRAEGLNARRTRGLCVRRAASLHENRSSAPSANLRKRFRSRSPDKAPPTRAFTIEKRERVFPFFRKVLSKEREFAFPRCLRQKRKPSL